MNIKKVLLYLVMGALIISFTACGSKAETSFQDVQDNMKNMKDFTATINTTIKSEAAENLNNKTKTDIESVIHKEDNVELKMTTEISGSPMKVYLKGNQVYIDMDGQKIKADMEGPMSEAAKLNLTSLLAFDDSMIKEDKVENDGSNTVYSLKLEGEKLKPYFKKAIAPSLGDLALPEEALDVKRMDFTVAADKENIVKNVRIASQIEIVEGIATPVAIEMDIEFTSINSGLKITFPDFKDYKKM